MDAIRLADTGFWGARRLTNRTRTLASQEHMLRSTGRMAPLNPAHQGERHPFWDSDTAKWLEAVADEMATGTCPPAVEQAARATLRALAGIQEPNGYLGSWLYDAPDRRYTNLKDNHELYTMGHLLEAFCSWQSVDPQAGAAAMAGAAARPHSGPPSTRRGGPGTYGHPEIELALMRWYRLCGDGRARTLAGLMVDRRGTSPHCFLAERGKLDQDGRPEALKEFTYCQAHLPVRQQTEAVGHAVRALYLYCGMTDLAVAGDASLRPVLERLWSHATSRHLYLTGGMGALKDAERFGKDYQLPTAEGYCETCASIALARWGQRMLQLELKAEYADVLELALHNTVLSGVSLDGERYFYSNPLAITPEYTRTEEHIGAERRGWFGCACCPPNIARTLAQLGSFVYSRTADALAVHLYLPGTLTTELGGVPLQLEVATDLPWQGAVRLVVRVERPVAGTLLLRIPSWTRQPTVRVAGEAIPASAGSYLRLSRTWQGEEVITMTLPMPVVRQHAHPAVRATSGCVAFQRGPLVYTFEEVDNGPCLEDLAVPDAAAIYRAPGPAPGWLRGASISPVPAPVRMIGRDPSTAPPPAAAPASAPHRGVPYCLWGNRGPGEMRVWRCGGA